MRTITLVLSSLALSGCATYAERLADARDSCTNTGQTRIAIIECYDKEESPIFANVPALSHAYDIWQNKRWRLAFQYDNSEITAQQYAAEIGVARTDFQRRIAQHEASEKAKNAAALNNLRKTVAAGLAAYGEAKSERAKAGLEAIDGLEAIEESKPKTGGDTAMGTAYYKSQVVSGRNKICYYDRLGSAVAITVASYELCPLMLE